MASRQHILKRSLRQLGRRACALLVILVLPGFAPALAAACDIEAGLAAFHAQEQTAAETLLRECTTVGEPLAEAHFYLGILARNAGKLESAETDLAAAVRLQPDNVSYRLEWAVTKEWLGRLAEAQGIYTGALTIQPGNLPARLGIARMEHWRGHLRRSLAIYRELRIDFPADRGVQTGLAYALMADNKVDDARALFTDLLTTDPKDASAAKGLEMLEDLRTHQVQAHGGKVRDALGQDISQFRFAYSATPSYAFKWGFELVGRNGFVQPPDSSGVPVNRAVKSSQAVFGEYRFNAKTSTFASLRREELAGDEKQHKLHLELMHKPSDKHRIFAGVIPALIDGRYASALTYAGYVYEHSKEWSAMAQFYYGLDREFPESQALSVSVTRNYGLRSWLRLGTSYSQTSGNGQSSAYLSVRHHINREWAVSGQVINNFSTNEREINLGVIYEF
ncbi:MAG: hypothetical protein KJO92_12960 [Gammaproteobacteria bacterium]|nr:hypothetical protein [Gammaproteobacteria bacterium]